MDQNDPSPDHDDNTNGNEETPNGDGQSTKGKTKKRNDWESQKTPYKRFRWLFTKIMDIENYTKSDFKKHELKELLRLGQPMVKWCQTVDLPVVEMEQ